MLCRAEYIEQLDKLARVNESNIPDLSRGAVRRLPDNKGKVRQAEVKVTHLPEGNPMAEHNHFTATVRKL